MSTIYVRGHGTFVREAKPGTSYITTARDRLRVAAGTEITLLRFRVDVPATEQLVSGHIEVTDEDDYNEVLRAQRVVNPGRPYSAITWNNRPAVASGSTLVTGVRTGRRTRIDVTSDAAIGGTLDFQITSLTAATRWLRGERRPTGYPRLVVVTQEGAVAPSGLWPAGLVSIAAPVFQWPAQAGTDAVQLAVAAVDSPWSALGGFSLPIWTSPEIPSVHGRVDTAAQGWAGLADGAAADVSARQHTPSGWSKWSEPITVTRDAKEALVITNPLAIDEDGTPPVAWAFGGVQTAYQIIVERDDDTKVTYPRQPGADNLVTPPDGAKHDGQVVTRTLRVWDDKDRAESPGDPAYVEASVVSTYQRTTDTDPMASLSITRLTPDGPGLRLDMSRSPLPDEIMVELNGEIEAKLDPDTTSWTTWEHPANERATYKVYAIVNGRTSEVAKEISLVPDVEGLWIVDPESERGFRLAGTDLQLAYGEVTGVYTAATAAAVIVRNTALRGAEGTMTGRIDHWHGRTVEQQVADLWWLRANPRVVRLVAGDLNIPVTLRGLHRVFDTEWSTTERILHTVRFEFSQTEDDLPWRV